MVENGSKLPVDYKAIGTKLLDSPYQMTDAEREAVLGVLLGFSSKLIENKKESILDYGQQAIDVKQYLTALIFGRIIMLRREALKKNPAESEAVEAFNTLKETIADKFLIAGDFQPTDELVTFFDDLVWNYADDKRNSLGIVDSVQHPDPRMIFIRRNLPRIIANNTNQPSEQSTIILD